MDRFPILFNAELLLLVAALVIWAFDDKLVAWRRHVVRRIRRRKAGIRCTDGHIVGGITPAMSAEEVVKVCNSLE